MINGFINVYKEPGYTSHDVVAKLRGIVHQKKIGHTGTLDPAAEGVLPVCLGKATRAADFLTDETKTYETVMLLGLDTDTQDTTGDVLRQAEVMCSEEEVFAAIRSFEGDQMQVPPMYSARKINGKKLYELAREGKTVEREARPVHFYEIRVLSCSMPRITMRVTCSRGTYIRTLCHDIGEKLGCGGCMEKLIRTKVGGFKEADAVTLRKISELAEEGRLRDVLKPVDTIFSDLSSFSTIDVADGMAHNGNKVPAGMVSNVMKGYLEKKIIQDMLRQSMDRDGEKRESDRTELPFPGRVRLYDSRGTFIGLYSYDRETCMFCPVRIFYDPEEAAEENSRKSVYEAYLDGSEEYRQQPLPSLHELKEQEIMESSYRE